MTVCSTPLGIWPSCKVYPSPRLQSWFCPSPWQWTPLGSITPSPPSPAKEFFPSRKGSQPQLRPLCIPGRKSLWFILPAGLPYLWVMKDNLKCIARAAFYLPDWRLSGRGQNNGRGILVISIFCFFLYKNPCLHISLVLISLSVKTESNLQTWYHLATWKHWASVYTACCSIGRVATNNRIDVLRLHPKDRKRSTALGTRLQPHSGKLQEV